MDSDAITITLDGIEVSGHPGMTLLELARDSGIEIPTLCHDPHLTPSGACRICLVEDERSGALFASCATPIAPGMMIRTRSARVLERRRMVVKLILASHPDSCMVCDKGNDCRLRQVASDLSVGFSELDRIPQPAMIEEVNPFIERDHSRCILCARCIRADQELVVEGAIDYFGRGFISRPATLWDRPLEKSECSFCGACVAVCPTGALMEKVKPYRGAVATTTDTVCPYCGCGCNIRLHVKDGRLVRSRPVDTASLSAAALCVRGSYGLDFVHSPDRLTTPLVRVDGELRAASWDQALDCVADGFRRIVEAHGPRALAVLGSSKCTNEENYLLQKLARVVLGTNNIDNGSRLHGLPDIARLNLGAGFRENANALEDIERSDLILVVGSDPTVSAPAVGYAIKRAVALRGAKLLLVDPRRTRLASLAHIWMRPRPGSDIGLINALAWVVIEEDLWDRKSLFISSKEFQSFERCVRIYTPEYAADLTGVPSPDIRAAGRLFGKGSRTTIVYGKGITQQAGLGGVLALANLAMLTGNLTTRGARVYGLQGDNNGLGACDMGALPDFLPGYQNVADASARARFEHRWGRPLPPDPGLTALEMVLRAGDGGIEGMYVVGENPALAFPDISLVREALASLSLLAVQDMFLTETGRLATVVLPAASFAEKEGTFTGFDGTVGRLRRAIDPLGESLPDWQVFLRLADRMGHPMSHTSPEEIMMEVAEFVPWYRDIAYKHLEGGRLDRGSQENYPRDIGSGMGAAPPRESRCFLPVECTAGPERDEAYPMTLLVGSVLYHYGSGTRSSRSARLKSMLPEAWVEVSEADAHRQRLAPGQAVKIVSPVGEVRSTVKVTDAVPPGTVFMPAPFPESPVNCLFPVSMRPGTSTPLLKSCAVRLEGIEEYE